MTGAGRLEEKRSSLSLRRGGTNDFVRLFDLTKSQPAAANFVFFSTGPAGGFDLPIGL